MQLIIMPAAVSQDIEFRIASARIGDIAPIFNLIQQGVLEGVFNPRYVEPRYQAGLGIQLFSACLFGKFRLPNGVRHRTSLLALRTLQGTAGFVWLVHDLPQPGASEIYMCALDPSLRGQGYGRLLLKSALDTLPNERTVQAECLPGAQAMQSLLQTVGFVSVDSTDVGADAVVAATCYRRSL